MSKVQAESNTLRKQLDSLLGQLDEANERLLLSEMGSDVSIGRRAKGQGGRGSSSGSN